MTGVQAVGLGVAVGLGALTEELGWQGFVWPRLHLRPLPAAAALGVAWAAWHVVPYVHMGHDASWIAWHCAVTVCVRVVLVWFFLRARR
ncbi:MAG: CPBP family intramembrane metalloprotease, partial [Myxococcales bacterium]|nr:CPBP family intramembrane metalloprotease [Myxococcales bacterium]